MTEQHHPRCLQCAEREKSGGCDIINSGEHLIVCDLVEKYEEERWAETQQAQEARA